MNKGVICESIKFHYNDSCIQHSGGVVKLQPKEREVLTVLLENSGNVVKKEFLLNCWSTGAEHTSDNSLTRVISSLRRKLSCAEANEIVAITNISGVGYKLTINSAKNSVKANLSKENNLVGEEELATKPPLNNKSYLSSSRKYYYISFALFLVMITAISALSLSFYPAEKNKITFHTLFEDESRKFDLSVSPNSNFVTYSAQEFDNIDWYIGIFNQARDDFLFIKRQGVKLSTPVWISNDKLAFRAESQSSCWIEVVTMEKVRSNVEGEVVADCHKSSPIFAMTSINENELLVSSSPGVGKESYISLLNIRTGQSEIISFSDSNGAGVYRIFSSPNKQFIVFLKSNDWMTSKLEVYQVGNYEEPIWSLDKLFVLFSVSVSNSSIEIRDEDGGLEKYNFDNTFSFLNTSYTPMIFPIRHPVYSSKGTIFLKGELYSKNLFFYDRVKKSYHTLENYHGVKHHKPVWFGEESVLYISTRTGISQLWFHDFRLGISKQVSNYEEGLPIELIVVSKDKEFVAVNRGKHIHVYKAENIKTGREVATFEGHYPHFMEKEILFTKLVDGLYQLHKYSVVDDSIEQFTINGGYKASVDNNTVYYTKYNKPGIWKYQKDNDDELVLTTNLSPHYWFVKDDIIYFTDSNLNTIKYEIKANGYAEIEDKLCNGARYISEDYCIGDYNDEIANTIILKKEKSLLLH